VGHTTALGGGYTLDSTFYGETVTPRGYVERRWTDLFEVLDFVDERDASSQSVIIARKPDRTSIAPRSGAEEPTGKVPLPSAPKKALPK